MNTIVHYLLYDTVIIFLIEEPPCSTMATEDSHCFQQDPNEPKLKISRPRRAPTKQSIDRTAAKSNQSSRRFFGVDIFHGSAALDDYSSPQLSAALGTRQHSTAQQLLP